MNNSNTKIYVDTDVLLSWKEQMKAINDESIKTINEINTKMKDIDSCIAGNIAEGIKYDIGRLTKNCLTSHETMKDLEKMIETIVETKINE